MKSHSPWPAGVGGPWNPKSLNLPYVRRFAGEDFKPRCFVIPGHLYSCSIFLTTVWYSIRNNFSSSLGDFTKEIIIFGVSLLAIFLVAQFIPSMKHFNKYNIYIIIYILYNIKKVYVGWISRNFLFRFPASINHFWTKKIENHNSAQFWYISI